MQRIDLREQFKDLYQLPSGEPVVVDVPPLPFLMIEWETDPGQEEFSLGVSALYSVAQTVRLMVKQQQKISFRTMPIETLWWAGAPDQPGREAEKNMRTVMILQPEQVTVEMVDKAKRVVQEKEELPASSIRLQRFGEGLSVQTLRSGVTSGEDSAIQRLQEFMAEHNLKPHGRHHQIHLADPMLAGPEEINVIVRQPVAR